LMGIASLHDPTGLILSRTPPLTSNAYAGMFKYPPFTNHELAANVWYITCCQLFKRVR
jgi:hypothetical protein